MELCKEHRLRGQTEAELELRSITYMLCDPGQVTLTSWDLPLSH